MNKRELMKFIKGLGVTEMGIISVDRLTDLPTGKVLDVTVHHSVHDVMPSARTVIILAFKVWDPIFNVVAMGPIWNKDKIPLEQGGSEFYQLYGQIIDSKAWALSNYLLRNGFDSTVSRRIALKPTAVKAGLGCRGKSTLIINPVHGPFLRFSAVLTEAEFESDDPFSRDLCGDCTRCIDACPTKALQPYEIEIRRCLNYAAENPFSDLVDKDVRTLEKKIIQRPTLNSFRECTICQDACPICK